MSYFVTNLLLTETIRGWVQRLSLEKKVVFFAGGGGLDQVKPGCETTEYAKAFKFTI